MEIIPDHVHLFLNCPPTVAPHQIMFRIKGYSSYELRKNFPHLKKMPSMWTRSYFCTTAGNVSSETIKRYIENQKTTGRFSVPCCFHPPPIRMVVFSFPLFSINDSERYCRRLAGCLILSNQILQ
ncbi:MAG: IS200/IS605 family transposase [Nostoc indistinguendum CM1-VF10]|nr:IS200/IS605 family transposase [Nostoc indistinguendum CM1-VF10]